MLRSAAICAAVGLCCVAALPAADPAPRAPYPVPKTLCPVETYGANLQRSMTLLATSTALKRNTVRVLFYGQSITVDRWSAMVADDLRRRFPLADLVIENRAIGGFHSKMLVRTAEADLYPFYPDLVIFHDYGEPNTYEDMIRRLRERTTADILHATDHLSTALWEDVDEPTDRAKLRRPADFYAYPPDPMIRTWWNYEFLPGLQKKYGTELADVRSLWKQYMKDHKLAIRDLLRDDIHMNDHGDYLMAEIIKPYLRHRPDLPDDDWKDRVRTLEVGTDVVWKNGKLTLPFEGNRVDLICKDPADPAPPAAVRIDGKKPSEFPELYAVTRAATIPASYSPSLYRVGYAKPRVVEDWKLVVTEMDPTRTRFKFKAVGSVTGEDGEGETGVRFVSKSGRVVIEPDDYLFMLALQLSRNPRSETFEARWSVVPLFADEFAVPKTQNAFGDTVVTVAQGLPNGKHTLEVTGGPDTPIAAVRVYRPPLAEK